MTSPCVAAVGLETLVSWFCADLPTEESEALEEHIFGCADCERRLREISRLGSGVRDLVRGGALSFLLTDALAARLAAEGVRLREFRITPDMPVPCGAAPDDDYLVVAMALDHAGEGRARLRFVMDEAGVDVVHEDIPLTAQQHVVRLAYSGHLIRMFPDGTARFTLWAEGPGSKRELHYVLLHSHAGPPPAR